MAQRYEYYVAPSLWAGSVYACRYRAQVFTVGINGPNEKFNIYSVKLFYQKGPTGNPSQVIVSLNSTDANGNPTGPDLSIGTIEGNEWKTNEWTEIFMSPYVLQPSTQYAIVIKSPNSDDANYVGLDGYGPYTGYNALWSGDCGSSWSSMALGNYIFEVWGEPVVEGNLQITQIVIKDTEVFPTPNPFYMGEGEKADFNIKVKNIGADDHFKFELWANEGEGDFLAYGPVEFDCPAGIEDWIFPSPGLILTMGNKDVVLIFKTFHLEDSVWVQDDVQSFTITLALEGKAVIDGIYVTNMTSGMLWHILLGQKPVAHVEDIIIVREDVINNGTVSDTLYGEFISTDVTPIEALIQEAIIGVGGIYSFEWTFQMPSKDVNITMNAGHIE